MPIERKYCGTSNILPPGYTDFDDRYSCLRKGFGVAKGKYGEVRQCRVNYNLFIISIFILIVIVFILLVTWIFFSRKNDDDDDKQKLKN